MGLDDVSTSQGTQANGLGVFIGLPGTPSTWISPNNFPTALRCLNRPQSHTSPSNNATVNAPSPCGICSTATNASSSRVSRCSSAWHVRMCSATGASCPRTKALHSTESCFHFRGPAHPPGNVACSCSIRSARPWFSSRRTSRFQNSRCRPSSRRCTSWRVGHLSRNAVAKGRQRSSPHNNSACGK